MTRKRCEHEAVTVRRITFIGNHSVSDDELREVMLTGQANILEFGAGGPFRNDAFERDMLAWYRDGSIRVVEDVHDGLESAIPAFIAMLTGGTLGKTLVRL